jgi:hypothetical protein
MDNSAILFELGFSLGQNNQYGDGWRKACVGELPPSMREWAQDHLVSMMRETGEPCGVWQVRSDRF